MEVMFKARLERKRPGAVIILSRIVTVTNGGLEYEADQRHAEFLMKDMGIDEGSRGVTTPGSNGEGGLRLFRRCLSSSSRLNLEQFDFSI